MTEDAREAEWTLETDIDTGDECPQQSDDGDQGEELYEPQDYPALAVWGELA